MEPTIPIAERSRPRFKRTPNTPLSMGKTQLHPPFAALRGRVGDLVFKQYSYGTVVTRVPRMGKVEWSPAQRAHRAKVRLAAKFYREVLSDAALKKKYQAIARKKKIPLPAATLAAFMRRERKSAR